MPSTYSSNLKIELQANGENAATWGDKTNTNLGTALEQAIVGYATANFTSDANLTLPYTDTSTSQVARALVLNVTSAVSLTVTRELIVPTIQKQYIVQNNTTGSQSITVKTSAGSGVTIPSGRKMHVYVDGTNVIQMFDFVTTLSMTNLSYTGTLTGGTGIVNLGSGQFYKDASGNVGIGTTSPSFYSGRLTIDGGNFALASAGRSLFWNAGGSGVAAIQGVGTNELAFQTSGSYTEQMRLTATGLGIGTASPSEKLEVSGTVAGALATRIVNLSSDSAAVTRLAMFTQGGTWNINANRSDFSLAFATGTTERMRLDASGNLGIGTASPSQRLEVNGSIAVGGSLGTTPSLNRGVFVQSNTNNDVVGYSLYVNDGVNNRRGSMFLDDATGLWGWDVTSSTGTPSYVWRVATAEAMRLTDTGNLGIGTAGPLYKLHVAQTSSAVVFGQDGTTPTVIGTNAAGTNSGALSLRGFPLTFTGNGAGGAEQMRLDSSGNLGIGTASPGGRLHITTASGNTEFVHNVTGSGTAARTSYQRGGVVQFLAGLGAWSGTDTYQISSSTGPLTTLDSSGNLGIGTASPAGRLDVDGGAAANIFSVRGSAQAGSALIYTVNTNGGSASQWFVAHNTADVVTGNLRAGSLNFVTDNIERMRIDSSGNLGIGTASPATRLDVSGAITLSATTSTPAGVFIHRVATDTMAFGVGGGERMRLDSSGNLGIGTASPGYKLDVRGITASGNGTITSGFSWDTGGLVGTFSNHSLGFLSNGLVLMRLDTSGNLGIGISSPSQKLHVYGTGSQAAWISSVTSGDASLSLRAEGVNAGGLLYRRSDSNFVFDNGGTQFLASDASINVTVGAGTLATTAINGFLYVPTCAGTPTGTPTAKTGYAPIVVNTTNNKLYFYSGGAWRDAGP